VRLLRFTICRPVAPAIIAGESGNRRAFELLKEESVVRFLSKKEATDDLV
jgi:hypothetical protein